MSWVSPSSYWRTHRCELFFSSFFPSAQVVIPRELNSCERTKRAELVHAYMGIRGNDTHMSSYPLTLLTTSSHLINPPPPAVLCRRRPQRAPRLPMSLAQAPGARVRTRCCRIPCLGHRNGAHRKNERWAEHLSWMAAARWVYTTMNRTMVSSAGGDF